jgi:predicted RNA-binding Zn ribbon-like protein
MSKLAPDSRDGFRFRGGHVALDFPATLAGRLKSKPRELLREPQDLARWLVAAELTSSQPDVQVRELEFAVSVREAIYRLTMARIRDEELPDEPRRRLNRAAAEVAAVPQLGRDLDVRFSGDAHSLVVAIAREAIELLGSAEASRIRKCGGTDCALLFLDMSRQGERRWCSMSACGNKAKVEAFRERQRRER